MKTMVVSISIFLLNLSLAAVADCQDQQQTPAEQFATLLKEYVPASGGLRSAKTDLQRKECVEHLATFSLQFASLADKFPDDPVALESLRQAVQADLSTDSAALNAWEMNRGDFPAGSSNGAAERIVALLLRDHVNSEKLGPVIDRMRFGYRMAYEKCLMEIIERNPQRDVQGLACLALAQFLTDRLRMIQLVDDRPELAKGCETVFGDTYLPQLLRLDRDELAARIESLLVRAVEEYGDIKYRAGTIGETAGSELYAIRNLSVGRLVPEIEGKDQDATEFKLSDYRGKVVLLYFWSEY